MKQFFDSRAAAAACIEFSFRHRKTRPPLPSPQELKAQREKAIASGRVYRRGPNGTTVFNFGAGYRG